MLRRPARGPSSAPGSRPLERALLPGVRVADDEDEEEDDHLDQAEQLQLVHDDRPREHEHGLDVEDDEQHRDEEVADAVAVAGVAPRLDAALVRLELHLVVALGPHQPRHEQRHDGEPDRHQDEQENRNVGFEHDPQAAADCWTRLSPPGGRRTSAQTSAM